MGTTSQKRERDIMTVSKTYDEMADRYTYFGEIRNISNDKHGFGTVNVRPAFVDLKNGGDVFWIIFFRKAKEWYWLSNNQFIILADGQRFNGVAAVRESEVTTEQGFFESRVLCNEELHCGASVEIMRVIGASQSVKMRLGDFDMTLPEGFLTDVREIIRDLDGTGGYGK